MSDYKFVRPEDLEEYWRFCLHHGRSFGRHLPDEIWHYTDADGLIGILESGKVWATQLSCLNDTLEQRYFGELIHRALKERRKQASCYSERAQSRPTSENRASGKSSLTFHKPVMKHRRPVSASPRQVSFKPLSA